MRSAYIIYIDEVYAPFPFFQEFKHFLMIEAQCLCL